MIARKKSALRREMLKKRDEIEEHERHKKSRLIAEKLFKLPCFKKAKVIATYIVKGSEVDTVNIIVKARNDKKLVLVPITEKEIQFIYFTSFNDLVKGRFGVPEPANKIIARVVPDIIIVPGLVFDLNGQRLGYGKGYYDRFLKKILKKTKKIHKIGICFDSQIVEKLPNHNHDQKMDIVITESRIIK